MTDHLGDTMAAKKSIKSESPYVVVRAMSGLYCGELESYKPNGDGMMSICLLRVRRIWHWKGCKERPIHTVEDIANFGVREGSKVSSEAPRILISDARCAVTATAEARRNLESAQWAS